MERIFSEGKCGTIHLGIPRRPLSGCRKKTFTWTSGGGISIRVAVVALYHPFCSILGRRRDAVEFPIVSLCSGDDGRDLISAREKERPVIIPCCKEKSQPPTTAWASKNINFAPNNLMENKDKKWCCRPSFLRRQVESSFTATAALVVCFYLPIHGTWSAILNW